MQYDVGRPGRRQFLLTALTGFAALAVGPPAWAKTSVDQSTELIRRLADQAINALQRTDLTLGERETIFRELLTKAFDLPFIARFVLGRNWRRATPDQRTDYAGLFGEFIVKTYSRRLGGYSGQTFRILGARLTGKKKRDVIVRTKIARKGGAPFTAGWRVREIDGSHRIIDITVEGISMAVTQRQEFASVVRRSGIEGLLQILRAKTQRIPVSSG